MERVNRSSSSSKAREIIRFINTLIWDLVFLSLSLFFFYFYLNSSMIFFSHQGFSGLEYRCSFFFTTKLNTILALINCRRKMNVFGCLCRYFFFVFLFCSILIGKKKVSRACEKINFHFELFCFLIIIWQRQFIYFLIFFWRTQKRRR